MEKINILWVDDEADLLKAHVIFLQEKGYEVTTVTNGDDALSTLRERRCDIVFLDEHMPGKSGIETLGEIKTIHPDIPVVMVTKSEEENLMDDAIGSKISDYLIKPVSPKQILLSLKKNIDNRRLVSEKTTSAYRQEFMNIGMALSDRLSHREWADLYRKIIYWELELDNSGDQSMDEIVLMQKAEANKIFSKFISANYLQWLSGEKERPVMSHTLFRDRVIPIVDEQQCIFLLVIDNLRYDHWKSILPELSNYFRIESEEIYYSILPTATQYARNALFAGLLPSEIQKKFPSLWVYEHEEKGKNLHEEELLLEHLRRLGRDYRCSYHKINNMESGKRLTGEIGNLMNNRINVIVYNFIDTLSHARTEIEILKELADDEAAYRSLTLSWFQHSPLLEALKGISEKKATLIITTDHGSVRVKNPSKVIGDKNTTTNIRYKKGRSLTFEEKDVFKVSNPEKAFLPITHINSTYVFAREDKYFVYPNNYNHFVNYFRNTFQHGGLSMEEMLVPLAVLKSR